MDNFDKILIIRSKRSIFALVLKVKLCLGRFCTMKKIGIITFFTGLCAMFSCGAQEFESVNAEEFAREIAKEGVQLVDVRTASEYAEGHIPNAVNIDVNLPDFADKIGKLDKDRTVAIYCRSGRRSKKAAEQAVKLGFKVVELDGGVLSWTGQLER
jgi:rhodanese-related sulfurtransferase